VRHHRVYGEEDRPLHRLGVSEIVLRAQLEMLVRRELTPVTVSEGLEWLSCGRPGLRVAFTFDDGYADNLSRALPLLRVAGARATFFLTAGLIEQRRAPWWDALAHVIGTARAQRFEVDGRELPLTDQAGRTRAFAALLADFRTAPAGQRVRLDELCRRLDVRTPAPCSLATWEECAALAPAGMEVGAHTLTHPFLSRLPADEQSAEIAGSFDLIARRLGARPAGLAYPGGDYVAASVTAARAAGAAWAVTTRAGDVVAGAPAHELPRRGLSEGACLGPLGRFSERLARAELEGAFDAWRSRRSRAGGSAAAEVAG
jgi:peptidoglycan/xylan/chitin deacetylase (PgdA/CDA1 family)